MPDAETGRRPIRPFQQARRHVASQPPATGLERGVALYPQIKSAHAENGMIGDWIYDHPTGLWGSILVCGTTALACLGLALFHPFVDVRVRRAHNDLAGFSIAIISVGYAVLLAFIAVATV